MDAIEAYEKYKHMDETISSPYFRGNNNNPTLLQDLWSAVKAAYRPDTGAVESCDGCKMERLCTNEPNGMTCQEFQRAGIKVPWKVVNKQ